MTNFPANIRRKFSPHLVTSRFSIESFHSRTQVFLDAIFAQVQATEATKITETRRKDKDEERGKWVYYARGHKAVATSSRSNEV